jgi:peptidoglycan/LPS O-acetylase OafA/YrhL
MRIIAALGVLLSHSFALVTGSGAAEPLRSQLGMTLGTMAVDIFFITSGFLVTGSLLSRQSTIEFIAARLLRIFPALLIMTFITVFIIGPYFTSIDIYSYFFDKVTFNYFFKNITLIFGIAYELPGVFEQLPFKKAVNGSLWTLPAELGMYVALLGIWISLSLVRRRRVALFRALILLIGTGALMVFFVSHFYYHSERNIFRLVYVFFLGSAFYVLKNHIYLSSKVFVSLVLILALSTMNRDSFFMTYYLVLAYLIFWFAYIPSGLIRIFNQAGDYSYGIYIYAFVLQQCVMASVSNLSAIQLFGWSSLLTFIFAFFSWHFIEKRALFYKGHCVEFSRNILLSLKFMK